MAPQGTSSTTRKIPIHERSVLVDDLIVVNGHNVSRSSLTRQFTSGGYDVRETTHFLLFTRQETPSIVLIHFFGQSELHADIKHYLMYELQPLGLLKQSRDYGKILSGIIGSFVPTDARSAWHAYGAKTLQRFLLFLSTAHVPPVFDFYATIGTFSTWYQRVCELCVGETFLDAGCESGLLPLVIAERLPFMTQVVGIDIQTGMFATARALAEEWHLPQVQFREFDLLSEHFDTIGQFDTVTAIGVIEHFTEQAMYRVLGNLLNATKHRLLLVVPYEHEPETIYEHKQVFTRPKLEMVGQWCVHQWGGTSRMWCEECEGGLLLIEKRP